MVAAAKGELQFDRDEIRICKTRIPPRRAGRALEAAGMSPQLPPAAHSDLVLISSAEVAGGEIGSAGNGCCGNRAFSRLMEALP